MAPAAPVDIANEKMSIDLPENWTVKQTPAETFSEQSVSIFEARNAENSAVITVMACTNPMKIVVETDAFVQSVKDGISNGAAGQGNKVDFGAESKIDLNGVPAYRLDYKISLPDGKLVEGRSFQVAANGRMYFFSTKAVDPAQVPVVEAMVGSLRFASPPEVPKPPVSHRYLKLAVLAGGGLVALIALVGGAVWFIRRRREEEGAPEGLDE